MQRLPRLFLAMGFAPLLLAACADRRTMLVGDGSAIGATEVSADRPDALAAQDVSDGQGASDGATDWLPAVTDSATTRDLQPVSGCGNDILQRNEQCDDGNTVSGDGCSALCQVESDWPPCPEGRCVLTAVCGNGIQTTNETCDDGNTATGDGCAADCQSVEAGWKCRVPGFRCVPICGDRQQKGSETCDDGNTVAGDGCSFHCLREPDSDCSDGGCTSVIDAGGDGGGLGPRCGDGMLSGAEECDEGAGNGVGDYGGCTSTCFFGTYCGDGVASGPEECDLGNSNGRILDQDGCTIACTRPRFCGDGIVDVEWNEECDFGDRNGRKLDNQLNPTDDPYGTLYCTQDCAIPTCCIF